MTLSELDVTTLPTRDQDDSLRAQLLRFAKILREHKDNHGAALVLRAVEFVPDDSGAGSALRFLDDMMNPQPPAPCAGGVILDDCGGPCVRCGVTDKSLCPFVMEDRP